MGTARRQYPDEFKQEALELLVILIEDKASGTQLIQSLIEAGLSKVTRYAPDGDKIMRLHAQTATIENGFVHLPREAHWLADYLHELTVFPNGRHDDQVDSTSQALAWTKQRPPGWGVLEYYRREVEISRESAESTMVRTKVPLGVSHVVTIDGRQHMVRDGYVTVTEENAAASIGRGI